MPLACPYCRASIEPHRTAQGLLLCPRCRNTGRAVPAAAARGPTTPWPAPGSRTALLQAPQTRPAGPAATPGAMMLPPAQDPYAFHYGYAQGLAVAQAAEFRKAGRNAMQEGVCGLVFGALGLLLILFGLVGLLCSLYALGRGRKLALQTRPNPYLQDLADKGHLASRLGLAGVIVAVVASAVNITLLVRLH